MKNKIILASSSPRRKELFDKYGIDYTVDFVETEEVLDESLTLFKRLENIALQKAKPLHAIQKTGCAFAQPVPFTIILLLVRLQHSCRHGVCKLR